METRRKLAKNVEWRLNLEMVSKCSKHDVAKEVKTGKNFEKLQCVCVEIMEINSHTFLAKFPSKYRLY